MALSSWVLVGLFQPIIVIALFLQRSRRRAASRWLFAWLALVIFQQAGIYMGVESPGLVPAPLAIGLGLLPLLHGPLTFGYVAQALPRRCRWAISA